MQRERADEDSEIAELESVLAAADPRDVARSLAAGAADARPGALLDAARIDGHGDFGDLPLSERTQRGLRQAGFKSLTAIQAQGEEEGGRGVGGVAPS